MEKHNERCARAGKATAMENSLKGGFPLGDILCAKLIFFCSQSAEPELIKILLNLNIKEIRFAQKFRLVGIRLKIVALPYRKVCCLGYLQP